MTSWTPEDPKWLYQDDKTPEPKPVFAGEPLLGKAWQRLQVLHTPFRTIDPEEYRWIVDWLAKLEQLFLEDKDLEAYYHQCFAPETEPPSWTELSPPPDAPVSARIDHIATIQAQFMEEVFYALVLDRHANAPDNRGWMNLFRRWGRSKRFNDRLDTIRSLLTLRFLTFYDYYILKYPCRIDEDPIPHPWDSEKRREDPRPRGTVPDRTGGSPGTTPHCIEGDPKSMKPMTPEEAAEAAEASARAAEASAKAAADVARKAAEEAKAAAETARKAAAEAAKKPAEAKKKAMDAAKKAAEAAKTAAEAVKPRLPGVYLDSGIREAGTRPPAGGADAAPASPRDVPKTEMDRPERPRQEDSGNEPGGSAPTRPNK